MPLQRSLLGSTGLSVSKLGFGAAPLGDEYGRTDAAQGIRAVHCALDLGVNFFDTAPYYGRGLSEERLGQALEGRRHAAVIATKCGRYDVAEFDFSRDRIRRSVDESLRRLRTDYIDLYQAHDIEFVQGRQIVDEAIPAMRELQSEGKIRAVGITGLQLKIMRRTLEEVPVDTVLSYCRYNLVISDLDTLLVPATRERRIGLINASPLLMGVLSVTGPQAWHPGGEDIKRAGAEFVTWAREKGLHPEAVALQFCLASDDIAITLVGISSQKEIEANVESASRPLDVEPPRHQFRIWRTGLDENYDFKDGI